MTETFDLIGVDGTSSGWVTSIGSSQKKCLSSIKFFESLEELLSDYSDSVMVIDIPVQLNEKNYLRECDILAKRYLGKNFQSSIFIPRSSNLSLIIDAVKLEAYILHSKSGHKYASPPT